MSVKEPSSPTYNEARDQSPKVATKKGKRKSCMRHCKRFWWAYLIAFICIVVLVVCLVIFVAVPKIAQSKIDEAELEIQGVHILRTESDAYRLEINSTIRTDGHIKAKIYPFQGVMYLEDEPDHTPFVAIDFPETSGAKLQRVNVSQDIKIEDLPAFTEFNVQFHNKKTLRVTVDGKTKVKPSGLSKKYDVNFKKTLEIDGLNVFAGTKVLGGELDIEEEKEEGKNFHGTADIPNASDFTLDIGNVSFSNFVNGTLLGHLFIQDLLLVPGSNVVNISAKIDAIKTTGFLRSSQYCHDGGVLPFEMLGDNVTNHGENISYFAAALASVNQTVPINIGDIIADSLGTEVKCASED